MNNLILTGAVAGFIMVGMKNLVPEKPVDVQIPIDLRRNRDEPMSIEGWFNSGQYLSLSGHPDELRHRRLVSKSFSDIQHQTTNKQTGNHWLLDSHYYPTESVIKRQQFKGPSNEVSYPIAEMGSGWYDRVASVVRPTYTTRIIPYTSYLV